MCSCVVCTPNPHLEVLQRLLPLPLLAVKRRERLLHQLAFHLRIHLLRSLLGRDAPVVVGLQLRRCR